MFTVNTHLFRGKKKLSFNDTKILEMNKFHDLNTENRIQVL